MATEEESSNNDNNNSISAAVTLYNTNAITTDISNKNPFSIKVNITQMLRGGAIIQVSSVEQAKIAESAGACCVLLTCKHQRMPDPSLVKSIKNALTTIPVMVSARVGHFVEAQILEALDVDYIDESEVLGYADDENFVNKHNFRAPFVCGCANLGEALRRVREGAAMIRTQGVGDFFVETVRNVRGVMGELRVLSNMDDDEVFGFAKKIEAPYDLVAQTKQMRRLPVVHFASGGIVTPADAAMMMQLGCDGVIVGSEVFDCDDPYKHVSGIVRAVRNYNDPHVLVETSCGLGAEGVGNLSLNENRIEEGSRGD